jgi:hypothetical protein
LTKIINIFGGPGIGKSAVIAGLFHQMKINHIEVEIANEVAKDYVWENQMNILTEDQLIVFAKQHRRVYRLIDKVDYVIADCPLLMCIPYIPKNSYKSLEPLMVEAWNSFDNISFLLQRPDVPYNEKGRYQNEEESKQKHQEIINVLHKYDVPYWNVVVNPTAPQEIFSYFETG